MHQVSWTSKHDTEDAKLHNSMYNKGKGVNDGLEIFYVKKTFNFFLV